MANENPGPEGFRNLFGEIWVSAAKRKGRPAFEWSEENSNKVSILLAAGWSNDRIAGVILDPRTGKSISVPTLKRHFRSELQVRDAARDRMEAQRLIRVWTNAQTGNVGAERLFVQLLERNDRMESERKLSSKPKDAAPIKVGKKIVDEDQAAEAAAICAKVWAAGLLPEASGIGLDSAGIALLLDALNALDMSDPLVQAVKQGWALQTAHQTLPLKLESKRLQHGNQPLLNWAVGNAKQELVRNNYMVTKEASGAGKIDPLMAALDAAMLMFLNPVAAGGPSVYETRGILMI